jgi:integrase
MALRAAEKLAATAARQGSMTIRDAIDAQVGGKQAAGARDATLAGTRRALDLYFAGMLDSPVGRITERVAQEQYDKLRQYVHPRTRRVISVATHRSYLGHARTWGRWLVSNGWIKASPLEVVRGKGKARKGKKQLSLDEARRFYATCMEQGERGDEGAVAALACALMATRSSEVLSRVVRDLDDGGRLMRVDDNLEVFFQTKTDSSKRPIKVPEVLQPLFARLALGKQPTDPLFPGSLGGRKRRQWLLDRVHSLCARAGVPKVCVHSLRGLMTSVAASAGETPELVAKVLGHTNERMTRAHYIAPGVAEAAQLERGLQALVQQPPALSP